MPHTVHVRGPLVQQRKAELLGMINQVEEYKCAQFFAPVHDIEHISAESTPGLSFKYCYAAWP